MHAWPFFLLLTISVMCFGRTPPGPSEKPAQAPSLETPYAFALSARVYLGGASVME